MSSLHHDHHYQTRSSELVCSRCIGDADLKAFIRAAGQKEVCFYCEGARAKAVPLQVLAERIVESLERYYGHAVEQAPYETREGGYQGWHTDTYDLLFDDIGLDLPQDGNDTLRWALANAIGDDTWCAYDWAELDLDQDLDFSWKHFCTTVKTRRRFFFSGSAKAQGHRALVDFLTELAGLIEEVGLLKRVPAGRAYYRARQRRKLTTTYVTPADLGPPPADKATQPNRMSPAGIPMFYGSGNAALAVAEVQAKHASIGRFRTTRETLILDLATMPSIPGFFSDASRQQRLGLLFLSKFAKLISQPITKDGVEHVEYVPTQALAEFLRDWSFNAGQIDGIRYPSATGKSGANIVLFASQSALVAGSEQDPRVEPWLKLTKVEHV